MNKKQTSEEKLYQIERVFQYHNFMKWLEFVNKLGSLHSVISDSGMIHEFKTPYCERFFSLTLDKKGVPVFAFYFDESKNHSTEFFNHIEWNSLHIEKTSKLKKNDFIILGIKFKLHDDNVKNQSLYFKIPISKKITPFFEPFDNIYLGRFTIVEGEVVFNRKIIKKLKREYINESSYHLIR